MALNPKIECDVLVVGTDPVLSPAVALMWRLVRPRVKIAHWCFDLYPEAAISAGLFREESRPVKFLKYLMRASYRRCDLIVDLGSCMRRRLQRYGSAADFETIVPWALIETPEPAPVDPDERRELFGNARLGLLYSGTFGRAHSWEGIPELAQLLSPQGCRFACSVRGNAVDELRAAISGSQADIFFAPYAASDRTQTRLAAADIHIVSLRDEWTGTVVPSKFFSALAIGRPVLFVGSRDSAVARAIEEFGVGWVLTGENLHSVAREILLLSDSPQEKAILFERCHRVYWQNFSRCNSLDRWDRALRRLA